MTIAFMRLLHRCEFFKGVEVAKEGLLRQSTMTPCETRCASLFPPSGGGSRWGTIRHNGRSDGSAEIRSKKRGSHGCERQIRLRRPDPSLVPLSSPEQLASTARNLLAGG